MAEPRTVRENANSLTSEEIAAILPHRYPFALVDRILDYEPGQWAIGRKCVTRNEEFFNGHFPAQPVMPGVLLLEALAQTGAVAALSLPENKGKLALFGGIKSASRVYSQVRFTLSTSMDSFVVWISFMSGPKETQSRSGILPANKPHSTPACNAWMTGSLPYCSVNISFIRSLRGES